jgi:hypothetical protein
LSTNPVTILFAASETTLQCETIIDLAPELVNASAKLLNVVDSNSESVDAVLHADKITKSAFRSSNPISALDKNPSVLESPGPPYGSAVNIKPGGI